MPSSTGLYASKRVQEISQIVPTFAKHLEKGDEFQMGIVEDKYFPEEYRSSGRPMMQMVRKEAVPGGGYDIIARDMSTRKLNRIPANSLDPRHLFEITDSTYRGMLQRNDQRYRSSRGSAIQPRRSTPSQSEEMRHAVQNMGAQIESNLAEKYRASMQDQMGFKKAIVEAVGIMAQEVSSMGEAPFSRMLSEKYRSASNAIATRSVPQLTSAIESYDSHDDMDGYW